jgi:hypothetical protein
MPVIELLASQKTKKWATAAHFRNPANPGRENVGV